MPGVAPLARTLHPTAWWLWALGLATAASRTTNPLLLLLIIAVAGQVVMARRSEAPWANGLRAYLYLALAVVAIRLAFRVLLGGQGGEHVLITLPEVPLPDVAAGIRIGGPVSLEGVLAALYDGLRLATLLLCVGAANLLANPKRLLRAMPAALHEVGVAVTIALSVAPQLVESGQRVRRARRLRGGPSRRWGVIHEIAIPVMTDALDRSLLLAAAMDSRGYGRTTAVAGMSRAATGAMTIGGLMAVCVGTYGVLDSTAPRIVGLPVLLAGAALSLVGLGLAGRHVERTRYRPDPWRGPEWLVATCGLVAAAVVVVMGGIDPDGIFPVAEPLQWPSLPPVAVAAVLVAAMPAWLTPPTPAIRATPRSTARTATQVGVG